MNKRALRVLEYDKIIDKLTEHAGSDSGKRLCRELLPMTDLEVINNMQQQTGDALTRIYQKGSLSFRGLVSPHASIRRLEIGGSLSAEELLQICTILEIAKRVKAYSRNERTDLPKDSLDDMFVALEPLTPLADEIKRIIIAKDEIADDASPKLKSIRRNMNNMGDRIRSQMNQMLANTNTRNQLQEAVVTMRGGRYCLPVKAEYKSHFPGMIHDQSSTGSTLFIEPMAIVKLNNELKELELQEKEEIAKILAELSQRAYQDAPAIAEDYRLLTQLDFIFARGMLAKDMNAMRPMFNDAHRIIIRQGRHPLLDPKKVVPIDLRLGEHFNLLVVTGPNTGGKTVSLKTVGLFTLMGQAGLHIPAADRSQLSIFEDVFADIGDEQSIEQSLSTFSSHMTNIVDILKKANKKSLVLFDELCAGTDPNEGAALAIAILDRLHKRGVRTMATTHYSEIKVYALSTDGVENACCEFDVDTLSPTYRLLLGIPGKSNAFAISSKLGLKADIIEDAKSRLSSESESFEDVIADMEEQRITIENDRLAIQQKKDEIEKLKQRLAQKEERLEASRQKILDKANEEAFAILKDAKDVADETIRNFHKYGKQSIDVAAMERDRERVRKQMQGTQNKKESKANKPVENNNVPKKLRVGDMVKVLSMNMTGTVHSLPDAKGNLDVQMGILRSRVNIKDLVLIAEDKPVKTKSHAARTSTGKMKMSKSMNVSAEINLIGLMVDEAISQLDKYLDDAYLAHLSTVRVVHGKGTGALRKAVHSHLKRQKYVKEFHLGEYGEGDAGVTIVTFE